MSAFLQVFNRDEINFTYCIYITVLLHTFAFFFDEQVNDTSCVEHNVFWNNVAAQAERLKKLDFLLFQYLVHVETV
jgi:hypothetical protein